MRGNRNRKHSWVESKTILYWSIYRELWDDHQIEINLNYLVYKKKRKQIYKITVLNIFTGFHFICKRTSLSLNVYEAYYDKENRAVVSQWRHHEHRCLKDRWTRDMSAREHIHHRWGGGTKLWFFSSHSSLRLTLHTGHLIWICRVNSRCHHS